MIFWLLIFINNIKIKIKMQTLGELSQSSYKDLQKLCKTNSLKAVGDKNTLILRLTEFFEDQKEVNTVTTSVQKLDIKNSASNLKYTYVNPSETDYVIEESECILQFGILVSNSIKNSTLVEDDLTYIFNEYNKIYPKCSIKLPRKLTIVCAIITLFKEEIEVGLKKKKTVSQVCDGLIEYAHKISEEYVKKLKSKK
jgi:hypothetical protein